MTGLIPSIQNFQTLAIGFGGPWEIAIILGIVLLLFGNRLPGAAKSLGMSFSAFKKGIKEGEDEVNGQSTLNDDGQGSQKEEVQVKS
jgi:sec-independent protein translocase protein TatA